MYKVFLYPIVLLLQKSAALSALSCHLVKWTGKHNQAVHPKHILDIEKPWYLKYIKKTDVVLDIGSNNGQHTLKTARKCKKIVGFDYDQKMVSMANEEKQRQNVSNASFSFGDAQKKFPYRDKYFNVVLFLDVLEHLNKRQFALREIKRILKPKGILLIAIPKVDTRWKKLQKSLDLPYYSDPDHKIEYTEQGIYQELAEAGFEIDSIKPITLDTPLVGFIDLLGGISLSLYKRVWEWRRSQGVAYPAESIGYRIVARKRQ